jgi:hypothetical protein
MKLRNIKKFLYGIPAYTGRFQALVTTTNYTNLLNAANVRVAESGLDK